MMYVSETTERERALVRLAIVSTLESLKSVIPKQTEELEYEVELRMLLDRGLDWLTIV